MRLHDLTACDPMGPIGAFDQHVGQKHLEKRVRGVLVKDGNGIDGGQGGQQGGALGFGKDGAAGALETADASVAV